MTATAWWPGLDGGAVRLLTRTGIDGIINIWRIDRAMRRDHAKHYLDMNNQTGDALLAIVAPNPAPIERTAAVVELNFLADVGRMSGR